MPNQSIDLRHSTLLPLQHISKCYAYSFRMGQYYQVVQVLGWNGATINGNGLTPLEYARNKGHKQVVKLLKEQSRRDVGHNVKV